MKLMTEELKQQFAKVGSQESVSDPVVIAKYFTPWTNWTWYATEYDPEEKIFFGLVEGHETEWGSFSLSELESIVGPMGLFIERDLYFGQKKISEVQNGNS